MLAASDPLSTNGALLDGIITNSEEMGEHHGTNETKTESMTWKHGFPPCNKFKAVTSGAKL